MPTQPNGQSTRPSGTDALGEALGHHVVQSVTHSGTRVQTSTWAHPPAKELFQIIPDEQGDNPGQERGFDGVLYKL